MTTYGRGTTQRTPTGMKVAPMSYAKLEAVGDNLRPLLPLLAGATAAPWKLDCWKILEITLPQAGYRYYIADDDELTDCAAFTIPGDNLVVLRRDIYDGLFRGDVFSRSTVIHELAHIVLRHSATLHRGAVIGNHKFFEDSEWQAKALTASIMMPIEACKAARTAAHLAEMCGTSLAAAQYRLDRLVKEKLVKEKPLSVGALRGF